MDTVVRVLWQLRVWVHSTGQLVKDKPVLLCMILVSTCLAVHLGISYGLGGQVQFAQDCFGQKLWYKFVIVRVF